MIIREESDQLICIEQNEHALISGQLVSQWKEKYFLCMALKPSVEFAITNHDSTWKWLDQKLLYLDDSNQLASFINYPLKEKINAYRQGIVELVKNDIYAGFLVSCHYASFFDSKKDSYGQKFLKEEQDRQKQLLDDMQKNGIKTTVEERQFHFDLLQLCDNISLYLCMNPWGVPKQEEVKWFQNGFAQQLKPLDNKIFYARWESERQVSLEPFPFNTKEIHVTIPFKRMKKQDISNKDIQKIYNNTEYESHHIQVKKKP